MDELPNDLYFIAIICLACLLLFFCVELLSNTKSCTELQYFGVSNKILAIIEFNTVMKLTRDGLCQTW